jgi:hypothetical protein
MRDWRSGIAFVTRELLLGATLAGIAHAGALAKVPDLLRRFGRAPPFERVTEARFANQTDGRFAALKWWAENQTSEEQARWNQREGTGPDGQARWTAVGPCGFLDSRGVVRAMVVIAEKSSDPQVAAQSWREVERAYSSAVSLQQKNLVSARKRKSRLKTSLAIELARRAARDQAWRIAQFDRKHDAAVQEAIMWRLAGRQCHVDQNNLQWLKMVVAQGRWPLLSRDGDEAAENAWLLAQHADSDPQFQESVLALMKPLVYAGEAKANLYALLFDRIALARGRSQRYATQFTRSETGCLMAVQTEEPEKVDERRASVGLPPISTYAKRISDSYHAPLCDRLFETGNR